MLKWRAVSRCDTQRKKPVIWLTSCLLSEHCTFSEGSGRLGKKVQRVPLLSRLLSDGGLSLSHWSGIVVSVLSKCLQEMIRKPMKCGLYTNRYCWVKKTKGLVWLGRGRFCGSTGYYSIGWKWHMAWGAELRHRKTLCAIRRVIRMSALPQGHDGLWTKQAFMLAGLLHPHPCMLTVLHFRLLMEPVSNHKRRCHAIRAQSAFMCPHERVCECSNSVNRRGAARHC